MWIGYTGKSGGGEMRRCKISAMMVMAMVMMTTPTLFVGSDQFMCVKVVMMKYKLCLVQCILCRVFEDSFVDKNAS